VQHETQSQADDMMIGAEPIARFVYGNSSPRSMRGIYSNTLKLSLFKHGGLVAARKSTLRRELEAIEAKARQAGEVA
jgi:hypothetical protein